MFQVVQVLDSMTASNRSLVLVGAGGHSRSCIDVISSQGKYVICGLVGEKTEIGKEILGHLVIGCDQDLADIVASVPFAVVSLGQIMNLDQRIRVIDKVKQAGFKMPLVVSPHAYIAPTTKVGAGTIVMHHVMINSQATIGVNCIVNTKSLVEHDVVIGDCCHISTGVIINGGVRIGSGTFIGSGTVIKEKVRIGERCVIGMGEKIKEDIPDYKKIATK
jgi:sugar O-acyltransferase (sialic acid O-acetyltransferase NeuD family)